jgi:hypothetical protein
MPPSAEAVARYAISENLVTDPCTINLFYFRTLQLDSVQMVSFGRLLEGRDDAMPHYRKDVVEITDPEVIRASGERFSERELTCQGSYRHLHTQFKLLGNDEDPEPFPSRVVAGKR